MSISVQCEECGKTYQLRDNMAGRKGKCPNGHTLYVPTAGESSAENGNEFAFTNDPPATQDSAPAAKRSSKSKEARGRDRYPVAAPADQNEFSFATAPAANDEDERDRAPVRHAEARTTRPAAQ